MGEHVWHDHRPIRGESGSGMVFDFGCSTGTRTACASIGTSAICRQTTPTFETPERFSKAQAGRAKNDECNRGSGGLYPCWAWLSEGTETELVYIVCIHICICDSSPWLVHSSWVTFLTAGSSSRRMHPLAGSSSSSSSQPPAGSSASSSLRSPSSELPLSYLLTATTVVIEDLHDETDVEVFPGGPEGFF